MPEARWLCCCRQKTFGHEGRQGAVLREQCGSLAVLSRVVPKRAPLVSIRPVLAVGVPRFFLCSTVKPQVLVTGFSVQAREQRSGLSCGRAEEFFRQSVHLGIVSDRWAKLRFAAGQGATVPGGALVQPLVCC